MSERETVEIEAEESEAEDDDLVLEAGDEGDDADGEGRVLVVDFEKRQSRKQIDKLREGRGPLMDKVYEVLDELHAGGYLGDEVQPVVFVLREKRRSKGKKGGNKDRSEKTRADRD